MAMTAQVKAELASTQVTKACCRKAEVSAMLRFAGGLHIVSGRIVVEAELDTGAAARRLRTRHRRDLRPPQRRRDGVRATASARAAGTSSGWSGTARRWPARPDCSTDAAVRCAACRPQVVSGAGCDAVAAWRGAFLAHGSLTEPGRSSALEVTCPGPEAALALVGAARRLGIPAKAREVRGVDRVVIRDGDAIGALLTRLGAHESLMAWEERRMRREVRATANRLANFDDANLRRSARAAVAAGARVERALEILGRRGPRPPEDGRRPAPRAQAGLAGGARRAARAAAHQGRDRGPDPPAAGDGGQARRRTSGIPDTEASLTPGHARRRRAA